MYRDFEIEMRPLESYGEFIADVRRIAPNQALLLTTIKDDILRTKNFAQQLN